MSSGLSAGSMARHWQRRSNYVLRPQGLAGMSDCRCGSGPGLPASGVTVRVGECSWPADVTWLSDCWPGLFQSLQT
jgi:hypothetical protein